MPRYEEEGTQQIVRGAVAVDARAWWSVSLDAPLDQGVTHAPVVYIRLRRHGASVSPLVDGVIELPVPSLELDAVIVALQGVVAQARRAGIR